MPRWCANCARCLFRFKRLVEEKGQDRRTGLRADAASAPGQTKPGLATFVRVVWQRVADDLAARFAEPCTALFFHDAGLVARYWDEGGRTFLVTFQAASRRPSEEPHGLWLLCPMESRIQDPHLDGRPVDALRNDGELAYLARANSPRKWPEGTGLSEGPARIRPWWRSSSAVKMRTSTWSFSRSCINPVDTTGSGRSRAGVICGPRAVTCS
ncbi:hypothetical protein [Streptomyces sp. NPDC007346]|uniref:hypothetical protein n=1 Tax=Streptomyces sp. NPDC007346 TaxID=3154682 RepID=UPI0034514495